jgi:hypothetical protein
MLAECLDTLGLEIIGPEVTAGGQVASDDSLGRRRWDGGVRQELVDGRWKGPRPSRLDPFKP